MIDEKWSDLKQKVKENFELEENFTEDIENVPNGTAETLIFDSPLGKFKLVRTVKPRVLNKKTMYSGRAGSDMGVKYEYAEDEFVHELKIFKWNELGDDWQNASLDL